MCYTITNYLMGGSGQIMNKFYESVYAIVEPDGRVDMNACRHEILDFFEIIAIKIS